MSDEQRELPQEIILIVDDNHNNLRFLAEILFERGYDIRTVQELLKKQNGVLPGETYALFNTQI